MKVVALSVRERTLIVILIPIMSNISNVSFASMAPKIERSIGLIWRKLRSKYEIQVFGDIIKMFTLTMSLYEPTF